MNRDKKTGIVLIFTGLLLNFSTIEFTGIGFLSGAICALGFGLLLFEFKIFKNTKK